MVWWEHGRMEIPDTGLDKTDATETPLAAIALGSNMSSVFGGREANLREAIRRVGALGRVVSVSHFRDTEAVGTLEQPRFLNGAMLLESGLEAVELMQGLLAIELAMGRVRERGVVKGPRVIDLDLLLFGGKVIVTGELTLPHRAMHERRFVLEPLAEIAPEMRHPVLGNTVAEMLSALGPAPEQGSVTTQP